MKIIIVTRHQAAVDWLSEIGIQGEVIEHVNNTSQIRGCHVIGNIPMYLAVYAAKVSQIELPNRNPETRGMDLSLEEMIDADAFLATYKTTQENYGE